VWPSRGHGAPAVEIEERRNGDLHVRLVYPVKSSSVDQLRKLVQAGLSDDFLKGNQVGLEGANFAVISAVRSALPSSFQTFNVSKRSFRWVPLRKKV
jgi:hypothetical protein